LTDMTSTSAADNKQRALRVALVLLLLSVTVLERFGLSAGAISISAAMLAIYPFLVVAGLAGGIVLSLERTLLYGLCMIVALASLIANEQDASFSSFALLAAMYLPFVFVLRPGALAADDAGWIYARFLDLCGVCAVAGVAQFALQFVVHARWLFDYSSYIPAPLRMNGIFNTVIPMGSWNKSNGFFFREPSGFSFFMALGVLMESTGRRRVWRLACMGLALLLTYSGTGLLTLLIGMLFPLGRKTVWRIALLGCVGGLAVWLLGDALNLRFTLERIGEFDSQRSSAYIRYIAPARLIAETMASDPWVPWVGHGPGTILHAQANYEFHDPTWAKLLFEYGVLGTIAMLALFFATLNRAIVPAQVRAALFFAWLLMGGHLLSPEQNYLTLALVTFLPLEADRPAPERATATASATQTPLPLEPASRAS